MLKKANIQWSAATLKRQVEGNMVSFDNAIQRNGVWDLNRKSLLIHSMIAGYPIPAFFFSRNSEKKYDGLDGKQRSTAIIQYMNDGFALTETTPVVVDDNGYPVVIAGKKFSELPEEFQNIIKDFSLTIYYFDDITDEEVHELFFRLNNGKPLTSIELTRVKAKALDKFQKIASHEIISLAMTEAAKRGYKDENLAMQIWTLCFTDYRDFTTKGFRPFIESAVVTDEQIEALNNAMDVVNEIYASLDEKDRKDKRVKRKIKTRSHLVSCIYLAFKANEIGMDRNKFRTMIYDFFNSGKASVSEEYNDSVGAGSAKPENVRKRISVLDSLLEKYKEEIEKENIDT